MSSMTIPRFATFAKVLGIKTGIFFSRPIKVQIVQLVFRTLAVTRLRPLRLRRAPVARNDGLRFFSFSFLLLSFFTFSSHALAPAISGEISRCGRALFQAAQGHFEGSLRQDSCPVTADLVEWLQLQQPGASFNRIAAFLEHHPDWPSKEKLLTRAEESLTGEEKATFLVKWFTDNPPQTIYGVRLYAKALIALDKAPLATQLIRETWATKNFDIPTLKSFWMDFKGYLRQADHQRRVDRLLMAEDVAGARHMFPWLNEAAQSLAQARIALIQQAGDVDTKLARVPRDMAKNQGLLYDRIKWHRRKESNSLMLKLLLEAPQPKQDEDLWWKERNLLIRRLMDDRNYSGAYQLAKNHGLTTGENFANAEWLAGWLALRFLNQPAVALAHFETLHKGVKSPISVSRAAYWASRAALALGKKKETQTWLAAAKAHGGTYYGQIALRGGLIGTLPQLHSVRPKMDATTHQNFEKNPMVQAVRLLAAVGATHLIEPFFVKLSLKLTSPGEQILLIEFAAKEFSPYHGVLAAKKLPLKTVPLIEAAYPVLPSHHQKSLQLSGPALAHAIIRQESRFKTDALSPAGAQGLMQLMPRTAEETAKKANMRLGSLNDPKINVAIGCAHVRDLLAKYNGSYILAIAAYNAGVSAVDKWIAQYGDPRKKEINVIDWVEIIPYAETRNYVQRVLENHGYYVQRLGAAGAVKS